MLHVSDFHFCFLERVVVALPMIPVDSVAKALMFSLQILTIEIGIVAGRVPPGSLEPPGAVLAPRIIVAVNCAELCPLLWQTITKLSINISVDNSEPAVD